MPEEHHARPSPPPQDPPFVGMPLRSDKFVEKILQPKWLVLLELLDPIGPAPNASRWFVLEGDLEGYFLDHGHAIAARNKALGHPKAKRAILVGSSRELHWTAPVPQVGQVWRDPKAGSEFEVESDEQAKALEPAAALGEIERIR